MISTIVVTGHNELIRKRLAILQTLKLESIAPLQLKRVVHRYDLDRISEHLFEILRLRASSLEKGFDVLGITFSNVHFKLVIAFPLGQCIRDGVMVQVIVEILR